MTARELETPKQCFAMLLICSPRTLDELRAHLRSLMHAGCVAVLDGDEASDLCESCDVCNALHALEQFTGHAHTAIEGG